MKKTKSELRKELLSEIGNLRKEFRKSVTNYQANLESEMIWCINGLSLPEDEEIPAAAQDEAQLNLMIKAIKNLKIKSHKGRLKDIRRIDDITKLLSTKLGEY